jgi:adenosylmethionine-8-amino-7-oxononanoate aminotransferase
MTITSTNPNSTGPTTDLEQLDLRHLLHPHQRNRRDFRRVIVRGKGSKVWDSEGREFIDAIGGGIWVAQVGHGRAELAEAARRQASEIAHFTGFFEYGNDKSIRLAAKLAELAPEGINRVFFTSGGSEGVDTAIKMARLFHHHRGQSERNWIIARHFGYHGATYGSGTATGIPDMQFAVGPNLPHVEKVMPPYAYHSEFYGGQDPTDFLIAELEQTIERLGAENIAAMIGEPVLGGGGVIPPPADYWPRVRQVLRKNGILLIADEVITAYGRIGSWFDSAPRGMEPDIIVTAKGITSGYVPLGAVLMSDEIGDAVAGGDTGSFFHGYTYSGHPLACAVALANLEVIADEGLLGRALTISDWLQAGMAPIEDNPAVGEVRVEGSMAGIELVADPDTHEGISLDLALDVCDELYTTHGVITRNYGPTIVLSPSLVLEEQEADRVTSAICEVIGRLDVSAGTIRPR